MKHPVDPAAELAADERWELGIVSHDPEGNVRIDENVTHSTTVTVEIPLEIGQGRVEVVRHLQAHEHAEA